jgi:uncharacterized tellurite resistance protein B-like protein
MIPFPGTDNLTPQQIAAVTDAMLKIAHVDGARTSEEIELIRAFYEGATSDAAAPPFQSLIDKASGPLALDTGTFPQPEQQDLVVSCCLMVAYADGAFSAAEHEAVLAVARQLGVAEPHFEQLLTVVKDHLLAQLSRLPDAISVARVAAELG